MWNILEYKKFLQQTQYQVHPLLHLYPEGLGVLGGQEVQWQKQHLLEVLEGPLDHVHQHHLDLEARLYLGSQAALLVPEKNWLIYKYGF